MADPNNVLISHERVAFMLICKAANTSIKRAVMEWQGIKGDPQRAFITGEVPDDHFAVAFVRHPFDRVRSCYADKIHINWKPSLKRFGMRQGMGFAEFVRCVCATPDKAATGVGQHFRSASYDLGDRPDFLGRVENIAEDWSRLQRLIPLPDLGRCNATRFTDHIPHQDLLRVRYHNDLERYGYEC